MTTSPRPFALAGRSLTVEVGSPADVAPLYRIVQRLLTSSGDCPFADDEFPTEETFRACVDDAKLVIVRELSDRRVAAFGWITCARVERCLSPTYAELRAATAPIADTSATRTQPQSEDTRVLRHLVELLLGIASRELGYRACFLRIPYGGATAVMQVATSVGFLPVIHLPRSSRVRGVGLCGTVVFFKWLTEVCVDVRITIRVLFTDCHSST